MPVTTAAPGTPTERGKRFQTQHTGVTNAARPSNAGRPVQQTRAPSAGKGRGGR